MESNVIEIVGMGGFGKSLADGLMDKYKLIFSSRTEGNYRGKKIYDSIQAANRSVDIIMLAVKPSIVLDILSNIKSFKGMVISFAAGLRIDQYEEVFDGRIVRAMSNIAVSIDEGCTVYTAGSKCNKKDIKLIHEVLNVIGVAEPCKEDDINLMTASSGSGIAYMAKVLDIFHNYLINNGIGPELAVRIVNQTMKGALGLSSHGNSYKSIIKKVACKGGTTEQGLNVLDNGLDEIIGKALIYTGKKCCDISKGVITDISTGVGNGMSTCELDVKDDRD
ncbi:NAD(P)-binding domain-containing protein [Candidatus Woesearchaeota archaeon]|nr:NAD(P)-binding domain-containing protein [Candidatus Woesearchaeota archaeon]